MAEMIPGFKPLCIIKGELILYRKGSLFVLRKNKPQCLFRIYPRNWKEATRLTSRFFRCEPKYALPLTDDVMLIAGKRKILAVQLSNQCVKEVVTSRENFSDPLNICPAQQKWLAVWGDYGSNPEHTDIRICGLTPSMDVQTIYTFVPGQIRHIHNIIPKQNGGYYIFTGDQENDAGIYVADAAFQDVKPVCVGQQCYRAVVGFDTPQGLLYATDAVNEPNYVYLLKPDGELQMICPLNGSCIYGTKHGQKYYFSTTVEPDENNHGILSWLSYRCGKGILSDDVQVIEVDEYQNTKVIWQAQKDWLPMKLMQYGSVQFPKGTSNELWCYPVAVKRYDGVALKLKV